MASLSVRQRIVMYLEKYRNNDPNNIYDIPWDLTQDGIAAGLRISRAHASVELGKLMDMGKVEERLTHIKNGKVKRKTYYLTPLGKENADDIRRFAAEEGIDLDSVLDLKRKDPTILLEDLIPEDRYALGCACAFDVPVPISYLPKTSRLVIPTNPDGMTVISPVLRDNILSAAGDEERAAWHGFAANYWFDRKVKQDDDYYECVHELLYHYVESGRNRDACKLISSEMYYLINSIDDQLHDTLKKVEPVERYAPDVLTVMIAVCLDYGEDREAMRRIEDLGRYDEDLASVCLFDLCWKNGEKDRAKTCISDAKDRNPLAGVRWASVLRDEGRYAEAREFLESVRGVTGTDYDNFAVKKFTELSLIDMAEGRYEDAYTRLSKARATVNSKYCNQRFSALERELRSKLKI